MPEHPKASAASGRLEAALAHHQAGQFTTARQEYLALLSDEPEHAGALHLLGVLELQQGDPKRAQELLRHSLRLKPEFAPGYNNLGNALMALADMPGAEGAFRKAVELNPLFAAAHNNLAGVLLEMGRVAEAVAAARQAVEMESENASALSTFGAALGASGDAGQAIEILRRALKRDPENAPAYSNLGNLLLERRDLDGAESACRMAVKLAPELAAAHGNLANALRDQGRIDEALLVYRQALELDPSRTATRSNYLLCLHYDSVSTAAEILSETTRLAQWRSENVSAYVPTGGQPEPEQLITIGYVSPDFRAHSVSWFVTPLLANYDRDRFRVVCYAEVDRPDATTEKLQGLCDVWRSTVGQGDAELSAQICADGVDILVDLAGHTGGNRLGAFARRPAPVQATWLGYPGTTGMREIDYRLTDIIADPEANDDHCTEQLVRLPQGFLCYDPPAEAPDPTPSPCIERGFVTFGSFNTLAKITREVVAAWAQIVLAVDDSVFVLKNRALADKGAQRRYLDMFAEYGVAADRVRLLPWTATIHDHLSAYGGVDIALDTFPYNGTTTTFEALWMGVPVVAVKGGRHAARVGASILERIERQCWVADTVQDYVAVAVGLAKQEGGLVPYRTALRDQIRRSPLCDAAGFTRAVEAAYREMWRTWCRDRD
jgi:protein O-GlcNAc transferase